MTLAVLKRDGRTVPFETRYIENAVAKAYEEVRGVADPLACEGVAARALEAIQRGPDRSVPIYEIQAAVEQALLASGDYAVAEAYMAYRAKRDVERAKALDVNHNVGKLIEKDPELVDENANKDGRVFHTVRDFTAGVTAKSLGLKMLPPHVANAHLKGDIHFHDLDYMPYTPYTNCCLPDFAGMLSEGYQMGNAQIDSPRSINTATAQIAQIIANVSSSQYGGVTVNRIDELLAPYAEMNYEKHMAEAAKWIEDPLNWERYAEERTRKDVYDAMQALEYEVNTLQSSNGQTPFVSIGFGLGDSHWAVEVQKAILGVRRRGLGPDGRTAIFPKLIFALKDGLNLGPDDPQYEVKQLALTCATERMYPDVVSYDKLVEVTGGFVYPMGCRSYLQYWEDEDGEPVYEGRMNLGVVTLNLPRVAMEARGDRDLFWELLDARLGTVEDALLYRVQRVKEALPENAPIMYMHGGFSKRLAEGDSVDEVFAGSRATVSLGYIGLYEVATAFFGPDWEGDPEAKAFTIAVLERLHRRAQALKTEHGYHFSVYSTPSESLTDRFCRLDAKKFGMVPDITDKGYYTNSFHYDVRKSPTPFEKIDFEKDYPQYCAGGFIHYCEYPVLRQNPEALEAVWDYAYDKVAYLGTNTPIDRCYQCGFSGEFEPTERGFRCPSCSNEDPSSCDVVRRSCGYLGQPQARPMIEGRHKEIVSRVKHMPPLSALDKRSF